MKSSNGNKLESEVLLAKIQAISTINKEIITRIQDKAANGKCIVKLSYEIEPKLSNPALRSPHLYTVEEIQDKILISGFIERWRVPQDKPLPSDPDELKLLRLVDEEKDCMNMTCKTFHDLVRLSGQSKVASRFIPELREERAVQYAQRFKANVESIQVLLGDLESQLVSDESQLAKYRMDVMKINSSISSIFKSDESVFVNLQL